MLSLRRSLARVLSFFRKQQHDADLETELSHHLELAIEENIASGLTPEEARRSALLRFGNVQQAREYQRATRGLPWIDVLMQDFRFALRTLRRDHTFALIAVLILALGIGANVVVFSVVNTILLRPLPFPQAQQLVRIVPKTSKCGESCNTYSTDAVQELQRRTQVFSGVTGYDAFTSPGNWKLTGRAVPLPVAGIDVMENFFSTLGVKPILGRSFTRDETLSNAAPVVLLTYPFWKRQLAADPNIVGKSISLNNTDATVVGVLPESFDFGAIYSPGARIDIFTPYLYDRVREYGNMISLTGRLKNGATLAQAQAEADFLFPDLDGSVKRGCKGQYTAHPRDLKDYVSGSLRQALIVLWCAVGLILLIVCVNLSNLLLARASARSKEFAMRTALGAGKGRIVRQLLTESLVLSLAGSLLGLVFALAATSWLAHQGSFALPLLSTIRIDRTALAWTLLLAILSAISFGVLPGLRISGINLHDTLKSSGHGTSRGRKDDRLRNVLVVSEIALACFLLVGAGLLLRSFLPVLDVDLGFQPVHSAPIALDLPPMKSNEQFIAYSQELLRRVKAIPGVESAGITDSLPMSRNRSWGISAKGKSYRDGELPGTFVYVITPGYLDSIGMRLIKGRDIAWNDTDPKQAVVIVNQTVANYLWPNEDPIDRIADINGTDARVIGVIADVRETSAESHGGWQMYVSAFAPQFGPDDSKLIIRSRIPAEILQPTVFAILRALNPGQPAVSLIPIQQLVDHAVSPRRFFVYLVGIFAGLGLLLASLGIYGVISYSVTQRTQEIGIRMALGATRVSVKLAVIRQTLRMAAIGILLGGVASLGVSSLIASLLFGTAPSDPLTFLAIATLLAIVAVLAGYIPARRASGINPMVALRNN
jgi:predicted permease